MSQKVVVSHSQVSIRGEEVASGKLKRILLGGVFIAGATLAFTGLSWTGPSLQTAQAWWKCSPGSYGLQLRNNDTEVRCFRPARTETRGSTCPQARPPGVNTQVGTQRDVDAQGNRDKCVIFNTPISLDPICPFGFSLNRRNRTDNCQKTTPSDEKAPNQNVP